MKIIWLDSPNIIIWLLFHSRRFKCLGMSILQFSFSTPHLFCPGWFSRKINFVIWNVCCIISCLSGFYLKKTFLERNKFLWMFFHSIYTLRNLVGRKLSWNQRLLTVFSRVLYGVVPELIEWTPKEAGSSRWRRSHIFLTGTTFFKQFNCYLILHVSKTMRNNCFFESGMRFYVTSLG